MDGSMQFLQFYHCLFVLRRFKSYADSIVDLEEERENDLFCCQRLDMYHHHYQSQSTTTLFALSSELLFNLSFSETN